MAAVDHPEQFLYQNDLIQAFYKVLLIYLIEAILSHTRAKWLAK